MERVCAIYARASLDRTERRISVDRQIDRCRALAAERYPDLPVVVHQDNNRSASDPDVQRPGFDALLAAIRRGDVAELVAHEQSRLTRRPEQWETLLVTLSMSGIERVTTVQQGVIPVAQGGRLLGRILAVVDAEESERIKLRSAAMSAQLATEGRPNGGRYYGYRRATGDDRRAELVVHEPEAAVVRRICSQLAAGRSGHEVAARLRSAGIPTGRGGEWRSQAVIAIARRPHIAGLRLHRGAIVGKARWEPIIEPEDWRKLQATLASRSGTAPAGVGSRNRRWLLTGGLAVCGLCGTPMSTSKHPRPWGSMTGYSCSPRSHHPGTACGKVSITPAELVELVVVSAVLAALDTPAVRSALADASGDPKAERITIMTRMTDAEGRVMRAAELYGAGEIDEDTWRTMHTPAARVVADSLAALAVMESPTAELPPLDSLRGEWDDLSLAQQQAVTRLLVDHVEVSPQTTRPADPIRRISNRLRIHWRYQTAT